MTEKQLRAAIYARVSTKEQTTDNQLQALEGWTEERGLRVVKVYAENESAWRDGHQRQLAELIKDAYQGRFDVVAVWSLDRISRGGALPMIEFYHKMLKYNIRIMSYQEPWTDYPMEFTPVMLAFAGEVAKLESKRRSERTKAGLERVRASGKKLGRPRGRTDSKKRKKRRSRND